MIDMVAYHIMTFVAQNPGAMKTTIQNGVADKISNVPFFKKMNELIEKGLVIETRLYLHNRKTYELTDIGHEVLRRMEQILRIIDGDPTALENLETEPPQLDVPYVK